MTDMKVSYVRRMLLSTPNLEQVARETDLDLRAPTPQAFQGLVAKLQRIIVGAIGHAGRLRGESLHDRLSRSDRRSPNASCRCC
jgi:hypothetical protein